MSGLTLSCLPVSLLPSSLKGQSCVILETKAVRDSNPYMQVFCRTSERTTSAMRDIAPFVITYSSVDGRYEDNMNAPSLRQAQDEKLFVYNKDKCNDMNYLELYKLLNKSTCKECGLLSCMAFAHAVINGERKIEDCPHLDPADIEELGEKLVSRDKAKEYNLSAEPFKKEVSQVEFSAVAEGLGVPIKDGKLIVKALGKDFTVSPDGSMESAIHIHTWVAMPIYSYIITGGNKPLTGKWVSFEELKRGSSMSNFFHKRCLEPLRQMAESHTDIFFDMLDVFAAQKIEGFQADYARVLYPLPKVPFLILYWKPEDQFESKLKVLFGSTADHFLDIDAIYILSRGMVEMFKNIISRHEEVLPRLMAM